MYIYILNNTSLKHLLNAQRTRTCIVTVRMFICIFACDTSYLLKKTRPDTRILIIH